MGLGLWSSIPISQSLEASLLALGFVLYARATEPKGALGLAPPFVMFAALCPAQAFLFLGPPPETIERTAIMALVSYTAFALLAF